MPIVSIKIKCITGPQGLLTYHGTPTELDTRQRGSRDESTFRLVKVLLSSVHQPQMRLDVHVEAKVPVLLVYIVF
jgi:hypothetical protein